MLWAIHIREHGPCIKNTDSGGRAASRLRNCHGGACRPRNKLVLDRGRNDHFPATSRRRNTTTSMDWSPSSLKGKRTTPALHIQNAATYHRYDAKESSCEAHWRLDVQAGEPVVTPRIRRPALTCQQLRLPDMTVGTRDFTTRNAG